MSFTFEIPALLAGPDVPDAFENFIEVIGAVRVRILQALVVQDEALDQVVGKPCRRPLPEGDPPVGPDAVAHSKNHVEVVVLDTAAHLTTALGSNYQVILDRCDGRFTFLQDIDGGRPPE